MLSWKAAHALALSQPEAKEQDHFGSPSFRVHGKIFAQLSASGTKNPRLLIKLSPTDQAALSLLDPETFSPVPQWGRHGWTDARLAGIDESTANSLLFKSWQLVAPKKRAARASRKI